MSFTLFGPAFRFHRLFTEQGTTLAAAVGLLEKALRDFPAVAGKCRLMQALAADGRVRSQEITRELSLTFIRPLDREDIYALNASFSECIEAVNSVAGRLGLYDFRQVPGAALELVSNLAAMAGQLQKVVAVLNRGESVAPLLAEIDRLREESDRFLLVGLGELYESTAEAGVEMLEILKWSQLYDRLETAIGRAQAVAGNLEAIVLKNL